MRFPIPADLPVLLSDKSVLSIKRRAKFLYFEIGSGTTLEGCLICHLGMTGRFRLEGLDNIGQAAYAHPTSIIQQHDHIEIDLAPTGTLIFNDIRRFGFVEWQSGDIQNYPRLKTYGPEPSSDIFSPEYLRAKCRNSKAPLKAILLNQGIVAGLGNIYACEALFRAKLHPTRRGSTLTRAESTTLVCEVNAVIAAAIEAGGSTLRDFAHADGSAGYFQTSFDVYGRAGLPCTTCKTPIDRLVQSNRSSFFCPNCQK